MALQMVQERIGPLTLLRLSGSFDLPQALELRRALASLGEVILDFSQVDDLRVHALGIVAQSVNGTLHLLGLRQYHVDVLGYLEPEIAEDVDVVLAQAEQMERAVDRLRDDAEGVNAQVLDLAEVEDHLAERP